MHDLNRNSASLESTKNVCVLDCGCQNHGAMPVREALATEKPGFVSVVTNSLSAFSLASYCTDAFLRFCVVIV